MTGLLLEQRGPALWLTLDRPEQRNALTLELVGSLTRALTDLAHDVRAVVVTGTGTVFCPGADATLIDGIIDGPDAVAATIYGPLHGLVRAVAGAPVPVVAALTGAALGGALDLALACTCGSPCPRLTCSARGWRWGWCRGGRRVQRRASWSARRARASWCCWAGVFPRSARSSEGC